MTLIEHGKDRLAQCQDNVTEWDMGPWCLIPSGASLECRHASITSIAIQLVS